MRGLLAAGVAAAAIALGIAAQAPADEAGRQQRGLSLNQIGNFDQPIYAHGPKGAPGLLFVVEREGRIKVMKNGNDRGTFLDIRNKVSCCVSERGMFSIAFAPWRESRKFFVFFTDNRGDLRISEFKRKKNNPLRAKRKGKTLLDINHRDAANHNGGQLQWGPDDRLYISTGDGATGGGPSQSRNSLLGKILRIDPLKGRRYKSPKGNPFVGKPGRDEIFALGLRNPWRFSFNGRKIVIADVGENSTEEVDYERIRSADGANFGWNHYEGNNLINPPPIPGHDGPIHTYPHSGGRCSITGGYVVRDRGLGSLRGKYVYGDFCTGQIRSLKARLSGATNDTATGLERNSLSSFGVDARKNVYVVASGDVFRIG
jgi:glucose/arabinose dehydrogenase